MTQKEFPGGSRINCEEIVQWGDNVQIGSDVNIECRRLSIGNNTMIGIPGEFGFRHPGGVRIRVDELVLGENSQIERHVSIRGGRFEAGRGLKLGAGSTINVTKELVVGAYASVGERCEISGVDVITGRHLWMLPDAKIGGGSAFEDHSQLRIGHWCHLGTRTLLNTARPITIGDEVGLGTGTSLYTHGAYASALDGKPVAFGPIRIGDRTWIPGAVVNPSVTIGNDCVIGVGSVVTRDIPDGCLAAGMPAKVIRENAYPNPLTGSNRFEFFQDFLRAFGEICSDSWKVTLTTKGTQIISRIGDTLLVYSPEFGPTEMGESIESAVAIIITDHLAIDWNQLPPQVTAVDCGAKRIQGPATPLTERLLNQLRRYGVRFNYDPENGKYVGWSGLAQSTVG
jgi:acetyltransferase-like isoleucine patch superfamily enzyme